MELQLSQKQMNKITYEELTNYLSYNPTTGVFNWVITKSPFLKNKKTCGNIDKNGYLIIRINYKAYKAHRLAWFIYYKQWPIGEIDHINGNRLDNKITNLRDIKSRLNKANKPSHRNGQLVGAHKCNTKDNKYYAKLTYKYKQYYLGKYDTELEAHIAYLKKWRELEYGT